MEPMIVVNGKEYPLPTSYTLGESGDMEKITGQGYDLSVGGALGLLAIAYVAVRRVNPTITVDDIRDLTMDSIDVHGGGEDVPPGSGADSTGNAPPSTDSSEAASEGSQGPTLEPTGTPA